MMISFDKKGNDVRCTIEVNVPYVRGKLLYFYWQTNDEIYAGLLTDYIRRTFHTHMQDVREKAYEQGYKDAKAKRRKQKYFWGTL